MLLHFFLLILFLLLLVLHCPFIEGAASDGGLPVSEAGLRFVDKSLDLVEVFLYVGIDRWAALSVVFSIILRHRSIVHVLIAFGLEIEPTCVCIPNMLHKASFFLIGQLLNSLRHRTRSHWTLLGTELTEPAILNWCAT